jgi:choline-sulfatase
VKTARRALAVTWLIIGMWAPAPLARAAARPPNVLFIAIDDLNDWVGPLGGHRQVKTPNLDRLAARGVVFTNAHCQAPLCNPSRTSVLTGLRPSTTGVYALDPWFRTAPALREWVTLPQYFSRHGYRTLATGKIFHDAYPPKEARKDGVEFDVFGYHGNHGPAPATKIVTTPSDIKLMDWGQFPPRDEEQEDHKVAGWAIDQLRATKATAAAAAATADKPFFLCVGFRRPHVPCYASPRWFDLYPLDTLTLPPILDTDRDDVPPFAWNLHWRLPEPRLKWMRDHAQLAPFVRAYLACVSSTDAEVGRVLAALAESGHTDDTVVCLWSDHGYHLGEKGVTGKNTLWERSTRVPLIIAGPGVTAVGRCAAPVELLDLYPTLADVCGLPANDKLEGRSLAPQLKDTAAPRPHAAAVTTHGTDNHAVRTDRWRYIRYADGSQELYDERADPNEWANLAKHPRHAETIRDLARYLPTKNAPPVPGSKMRLIEIKNGVPTWEGKAIAPGEAVPD